MGLTKTGASVRLLRAAQFRRSISFENRPRGLPRATLKDTAGRDLTATAVAGCAMLTRFFEHRRQHHALEKFGQSVLGDALWVHTQKYFNTTILGGLSQKLKHNIVEQFSKRLIAIDNAPNAFMTFREELCNAATSYANLQVLCLTPEEKSATFGNMRYISGELSRYIRQCADFNNEIAKIIRDHQQCNNDELITFTKANCAVLLYYLEGWNLVRVAARIEPLVLSADKDWFRPFIRSTLIFSEDIARQKLGLPRLCPDRLAALRHHCFMMDVESGKANPLLEWEQFFGRKHVEDS